MLMCSYWVGRAGPVGGCWWMSPFFSADLRPVLTLGQWTRLEHKNKKGTININIKAFLGTWCADCWTNWPWSFIRCPALLNTALWGWERAIYQFLTYKTPVNYTRLSKPAVQTVDPHPTWVWSTCGIWKWHLKNVPLPLLTVLDVV